MSECREHDELLDAAPKTVMLAVRLLDHELAWAPRRVAKALEGEDF